MPLLTTVLLSSSRYSERITSVLYISTYCFNIAPRQWMDMNAQSFRRNAWFSGNPWWPVLGYHFIIPVQQQQNTDLVTWTLLRCETSEGRGEVSVTRDARRRRGERRGGECLHFCLWAGDWREDGAQRGSVWWWTVTGGTGAEQHRRTGGNLWQDPWYSSYQIDLLDSYLLLSYLNE